MKITLLGHYDLASLYAMNRLLRGAPEHAYTLFLSGAAGASPQVPEALQKLAATDRTLSNRFLEDTRASSTLKNARDLPAPNSVDGLALLRASDPDLFVSIRYRRILKDAAIAIPRHGVLNLHSGILPDYRGVMATFWAMLHGEAEIGSTLHRIVDSGIDTGPVIRISRQPLLAGDSYLANVLSLYQPGCDAILAAIAAIGSGDEPVASQQKTGDGRYFSTPKEDDLALFFRQGGQLAHGAELDSVRPK